VSDLPVDCDCPAHDAQQNEYYEKYSASVQPFVQKVSNHEAEDNRPRHRQSDLTDQSEIFYKITPLFKIIAHGKISPNQKDRYLVARLCVFVKYFFIKLDFF